ncbi:hypothetical protein HRI_001654900 [Hibiscus trionum]|uniref:CASP-like protein n=1 Tax=Hibiscus trionum TaxID=183268 RepID=A0A9W7HML2_HIBTR|nr:hypothetical protein HRI_001654900 [Hibiscus trionum]
MTNSHEPTHKTDAAPPDVQTPTPGFGFGGVSAITRPTSTVTGKFDNYEEYRYLLAIAILSTLYTGVQASRHVNALWNAKQILDQRISAMVDFVGDQVVAYLLISSVSAAILMTNRMREGQDNIFTDSSAWAISMSFFAFLLLAISALISGYKLSTQSYI